MPPSIEVRAGVVAILPAALAVVPFALLLGARAAEQGLSPLEVGLMGALVFAGSAQFIAIDAWSHPAPWAVLALTTLFIGLLAGFWRGRETASALKALPAAVLMSVIAPMVFLTGPAEAIAAGLTLFLAFRLPLLVTVVAGVLAVVALRAVLG